MMKMHAKALDLYTAGFIKIPYDDVDALEAVLKSATTIADFLLDTRRGWSLCSK
jgi:ornithine--oxo-acid transaminase